MTKTFDIGRWNICYKTMRQLPERADNFPKQYERGREGHLVPIVQNSANYIHTWSKNIHFCINSHQIKLVFHLPMKKGPVLQWVKLIKLNGLSHFISVTKKKDDDESLYMSFTRKLITLCNGLIICLYKERICLWCISAPIM